ncbi:hypothetical protein FEM48_Zijuj04G0171400 [Ziziphus jujuba var. spinosa]|uniref:Disease resistance N-terminal domain-containing protein n=1 Tax=Ziziphus jujuba var. spinosa TaxID=714518 RepID=A0A978VL42_ZIZJJ|nr:hypothetical protein FEM48_Zijuj04G0171400 [Ziziphus jujuba var. spinosa]
MADIAPVVLESLINLIIKEAKLLSEAKINVDLLEIDLGVMKAFLKDSVGKQHSNNVVKEIIDQISKVALEAEDVIDTYMGNKIMKQRRKTTPMRKLVSLPRQAKMLHDVATESERIKLKIKEIYANIETYGINEAESSAAAAASAAAMKAGQRLQNMRRKVEEDDVVGFVHDREELVFQEEECPSYLEPLGKELAEGYKGLPLFLVVLGGYHHA